ncbi:MAG: methyltransferase [Desulfobacter sp.]
MNIMEKHLRIIRHLAGYFIGTAVFIFLIPLGFWWLSLSRYPVFRIQVIPDDGLRLMVSLLIFVPGMIFVVWSNLYLLVQGKEGPVDAAGIRISPRTKKLVRQGPYKLTRNPMVFGIQTVYISVSVFLNSLGCLGISLLFFHIIVRYVVAAEEVRLFNDFGSAYLRYKEKTPRIMPLSGQLLKKLAEKFRPRAGK